MECPSCKRWVRFVEKDLVKNLKVFGLSLIGVEDPKRVFACPSCNTAIEPPQDAGLSRSDPRVVALERKIQRYDVDVELWSRRAALAESRGDDVLAREARSVVERARAERDKLAREVAALTAWDEEREEKPVVVARVRAGSNKLDTEGPSIEKAFSALKSKISGVTSAVVGEQDEPLEARRDPLVSRAELEESRRREAALEQAAELEFAALKARLKPGASERASELSSKVEGGAASPSAVDASQRAAPDPASAEAPSPPEQSRGGGEDFARSAVSGAELGLALDYAPRARTAAPSGASPGAQTPSSAADTARGPSAPAEPPNDDDDPVAALKRKLKKPSV